MVVANVRPLTGMPTASMLCVQRPFWLIVATEPHTDHLPISLMRACTQDRLLIEIEQPVLKDYLPVRVMYRATVRVVDVAGVAAAHVRVRHTHSEFIALGH